MARRAIDRRGFLKGAATAGLATGALWVPRQAGARAGTLLLSIEPEATAGTTLESVIVRADRPGYARLLDGPPEPTIVRDDLATPSPGRSDRRRPLAAIIHLTDIHLIDAQSPVRVEFLDHLGDPFTSAFRPQETLTVHVAASMLERLSRLPVGPITGRPFDCAVSTGDNVDNQQTNEARWFVDLLDGAEVTPDSGDHSRYEGVQDGDPRYWNPEEGATGRWTDELGFPAYPGLLDAARRPVRSPGLAVPWYSTYGNHDGLVQGVLPVTPALAELYVDRYKLVDLPEGMGGGAFIGSVAGAEPAELRSRFDSGDYPYREVTPDEGRAVITPAEWIRLHLESPATPGPAGHGYTEDHLELPSLHYEFEIAPGVTGISLDTGGYSSGSIGETQMQWIEEVLAARHSRYFDESGTEIRTGNDDQLVVLFSHFNHRSMTRPMVDPERPDERRVLGPEFVEFVHRWPNVVAWVNGHHHVNEVQPMPDPAGRTGGFWDINTASHVDHPQHARLVELVDNDDGTLSIFCTMVDHAAPAATDPDDRTFLGLASIARELAANDPQSRARDAAGRPEDRNVELVITAPFDLKAAGIGDAPSGERASGAAASDSESESDDLPVLAGVAAGVAAVGVAGAVALRRRRAQVASGDGPG